MNAPVISLSGAKAFKAIGQNASDDLRVWDRLVRLCDLLTSGGASDAAIRARLWDDAACALEQYIDNEWPVEKDNPVRATDIADRAAYLFVTGTFGGSPDKATALQVKVIEALEESGFTHQRWQFRDFVDNYQQALLFGHAEPAL